VFLRPGRICAFDEGSFFPLYPIGSGVAWHSTFVDKPFSGEIGSYEVSAYIGLSCFENQRNRTWNNHTTPYSTLSHE